MSILSCYSWAILFSINVCETHLKFSFRLSLKFHLNMELGNESYIIVMFDTVLGPLSIWKWLGDPLAWQRAIVFDLLRLEGDLVVGLRAAEGVHHHHQHVRERNFLYDKGSLAVIKTCRIGTLLFICMRMQSPEIHLAKNKIKWQKKGGNTHDLHLRGLNPSR